MAPTLRANQHSCQNGLVLEDHSTGFRIKSLWLVGLFIGHSPGEVRPGEVRPWFDLVAVDLHDNHATSRSVALPERPDRLGLPTGPVAAGECRLPPPV